MSLKMAHQSERLTRRGSFRTRPAELAGLGLPEARAFPVRANTLVVADTHGFHARAPSARPTRRVEIWAYGRRNPFLPWTGLDIWSVPALGSVARPFSGKSATGSSRRVASRIRGRRVRIRRLSMAREACGVAASVIDLMMDQTILPGMTYG